VNHLPARRNDEKLRCASPSRQLRGLEAKFLRQCSEPRRNGRGDELSASAGVLIACARELVETDETDAERDGYPNQNDEERRKWNERPAGVSTRCARAERINRGSARSRERFRCERSHDDIGRCRRELLRRRRLRSDCGYRLQLRLWKGLWTIL
jgi:hypothetical protein